MKQIRNVLIQGFIVLVICFVLFGMIELSLTALKINPESPFDVMRLNVTGELLGQYDEDLFWRMKDVKPEFSPGAKRIMCLTDSVSVMYEGAGYPDLLQKTLTEMWLAKNIEVFNAGVPGYSSYQGLKYFTRDLLNHNPDLVVLCYGWNDHWTSNNGSSDKDQKSTLFKLLVELDSLRIVRLVYSKTMKSVQTKYSKMEGGKLRVELDDYRHNLQSFVDICKKNDIKLIMMTAPYYKLPKGLLKLHEDYNNIVRDIAYKNNILCLDPIDQFLGKKKLFIDPENDSVHYNWEGSKIISKLIAEKVLELL